MCFYIHPKHPEMKTAKRDIVCYKNGFGERTSFRPLYQSDYRYVLGKLNKIKNWIGPDQATRYGYVSEGFHSYSNKKELNRSFHSVKCIIPKGAHYFYNPDNREYVSDQIIVQEFM